MLPASPLTVIPATKNKRLTKPKRANNEQSTNKLKLARHQVRQTRTEASYYTSSPVDRNQSSTAQFPLQLMTTEPARQSEEQALGECRVKNRSKSVSTISWYCTDEPDDWVDRQLASQLTVITKNRSTTGLSLIHI